MARKMPDQKPGKSVQVVATPKVFLRSVLGFLGISAFYRDLAALRSNTVAKRFYTPEDDALLQDWRTPSDEWNWLNPEYAHIMPWVRRANEDFKPKSLHNTAVLIPASVGANWWRDWVHEKALVLFLNGRLTFVGHDKPYPKDLALLLYSPMWAPGYEVWNWRQ